MSATNLDAGDPGAVVSSGSRIAIGHVVRRMRRAKVLRTTGLLLATGVLLLILAINNPAYISLSNLQIVGIEISEVGIAAVGTTFLMVSGNVDLSIGSMTGLVATASAIFSTALPEPLPILLGIAVGLVCGLFNGILVWRVPSSPLIITIGSLSLMYGIALLLNNGSEVPNVPAGFLSFGSASILGFSIEFFIFIVLVLIGWVILSSTQLGRHLYAIGGNREAAGRVGIPVRRYIIGAFVATGVLVGLGGVLLASRYGTASPDFGVNLEIQVITAVVLGGVAFSGGEGGMGGVLIAVFFLGILESAVVSLGINQYYANVIEGAALIFAVTLDQFMHEHQQRRQRAIALADAVSLAADAEP